MPTHGNFDFWLSDLYIKNMKLRHLGLVLSFSVAGVASPAWACGLHGFSFGAEWEPYPPNGSTYQEREFSPVSTKTDPAKRPVFSNAASRASEIAKRRAKVKAEKTAKTVKEVKLTDVKSEK